MSSDLAAVFDGIDDELTPMEEDCPCGSHRPFQECCYLDICPEDMEEAIVFALKRHPATSHLSEHEMWRFAEGVYDIAWPLDPPDYLHEAEMTTAKAVGIGGCRYCADTGHFYGDPELGPCGCTPEEIDIEALIG